MATEPNTLVRIFHSIPFDKDYKHTKYFASKSEQDTYFLRNFKQYNSNSFQRINKNTIRIEEKAEDILDYNYIAFKNQNHGNRWIYGFILSADYINENTTEITYKVDVMQTYFFTFDNLGNQLVHFDDSFVEREMSATDNPGDNIAPESIEMGEYVFNNYTPVMDDATDVYTVVGVCEVDTGKTTGTNHNGVYSGVSLYAFATTEMTEIDTFLADYINRPEEIVCMYQVPAYMLSASGTINPTTHLISSSMLPYQNLIASIPAIAGDETLDGYTPKNKKLYTYPYNFLHVDNGQGEALSLRYEFFNKYVHEGVTYQQPYLLINGVYSQPVSVTCSPAHYKGCVDGYTPGEQNYHNALNTESITLSNFPMCSWRFDSYSVWVAQNTVPTILGLVSNLGSLGVSSVYSKHPSAMIGTSLLGDVTQTLSSVYSASIKADVCRGKANNAGGGVAYKTQQFFYGRCSLNAKDAEIIDNYFHIFGYQTNKVKMPNLATRPHWNYVKTAGANIYGKANATVLAEIEEIFNKGITLWKDDDNYGLYRINGVLRDNAPVTT